jgi:hypothetical protein
MLDAIDAEPLEVDETSPPGAVTVRAAATPPVPNSGTVASALSDYFEDTKWFFDRTKNRASNGKWYGSSRGAPENLSVVPLPAGTIPGAVAALSMSTKDGNDANPSQEDLVMVDHKTLFGRYLARADLPRTFAIVRVPAVTGWVTNGYALGLRVAMRTAANTEYYPSIFFYRKPGENIGRLVVRLGDGKAQDLIARTVTTPGWYTIGFSTASDGRVHYFFRAGAGGFSDSDRIWSSGQFNAYGGSDPLASTLRYSFLSLGANGTATTPAFLGSSSIVGPTEDRARNVRPRDGAGEAA